MNKSATASLLVVVLAIAVASPITGCVGGATPSAGPPVAKIPAVFAADTTKTAPLPVTAKGGGVAVRSGDATAAVRVPAGSAPADTIWRVTPLKTPPSGVTKPLCPGIYVDTAGGAPTAPCSVGFALPGKAPEGATIVRIADDGSSQIVPSSRLEAGGMTLLTASVDGFSAYTTSEEDKAARDKAFVDRAKARGKQVDFTVKVAGTEQQTNQGWTFDYDFDLFASGGDVDMSGVYRGYATLGVKGTYKGPAIPFIKSSGKISGTAKDPKLQFTIIEASMADLLTGAPVGDPFVSGIGLMQPTEGGGSLGMQASGPGASGSYNKSVKGGTPIAFTIKVVGDDVQLEIPNVGIFPGKILRTTK